MIDTKMIIDWFKATNSDLHNKEVIFAKQLCYYDDFTDRNIYYNKIVVLDTKNGRTDTWLQYLGERWYLK